MNISNFSSYITKFIEQNEFLNTKINFGNIDKNGILDCNINEFIYNRFKSFIQSKYKMENKKIKIYYLNDMKLYSYNDNTHICVRELPSHSFDFNLNDKKSNISFRLISKNQRMLDNIYFPSLSKYDNINFIDIDFCNIKYKNSEILLEFHNNNGILSIILKTKIDKYNINNFLLNFQFILSKLLIKKINLKQTSLN